MVGGIGSFTTGKRVLTPGSMYPYAPILFDYIRRSMPMDAPQTLTANEVSVGEELPLTPIPLTPTLVVSAALATRDFQDVHHDRDRAVRRGSKDIFLNILTTTGLVQRYVPDWAGPDARILGIAIRLGVPCYAYETLTLTGTVVSEEDGVRVVEVVGSNSLGNHVTGTVRVGGVS